MNVMSISQIAEAAAAAERIMAPGLEGGAAIRPGVHLWRLTERHPPLPTVYEPALCIVLQGRKRATIHDAEYEYDPGHYLVAAMTVPARSELLDARPDCPFLAVVIGLDPAHLGPLLRQVGSSDDSVAADSLRPMASTPMDPGFARTLLRLLDAAASDPMWEVLGESLLREVHYLALVGPAGGLIREVARQDGPSAPAVRAIRYLESHVREGAEISALARVAGLSPSALHRHFKRATGQTPIQFLKKLRLHRANDLLLSGGGVTQAAMAVGYGSVSQFSREFKRHFGVPPSRAR